MIDEPAILLVEDNADDEALTVRALESSHLKNEVVALRDGGAALQYLFGDEARPLPALILLDLKLPVVDGLEVLRRIRSEARTKLLPVVILTASTADRDFVEGYKLGCNSYVRKPVDFNRFAEAVRQLGLYWLVLNERAPHPVTRR